MKVVQRHGRDKVFIEGRSKTDENINECIKRVRMRLTNHVFYARLGGIIGSVNKFQNPINIPQLEPNEEKISTFYSVLSLMCRYHLTRLQRSTTSEQQDKRMRREIRNKFIVFNCVMKL